ncbi:MAG: hypothetical protein EXR27_22555 [Betaproteobacteria bacterium]|nr:hypothetical protein [Betaproteobacteria bacterium]
MVALLDDELYLRRLDGCGAEDALVLHFDDVAAADRDADTLAGEERWVLEQGGEPGRVGTFGDGLFYFNQGNDRALDSFFFNQQNLFHKLLN